MAIPEGCRWGVDSYMPLHNPTGGMQSLYDFVKDKCGEAPDFWGRYLGQVNNGAWRLSKDEVKFLRDKASGTRIALIFNGIVNPRVSTPKPDPDGEYQQGWVDAMSAASAARGVEAPAGVSIYANVEPKSGTVSANWIRGWWDGMITSGYKGGIYGNFSEPFKFIGYVGGAYNAAMKRMPDSFDSPLWANIPHRGKKTPAQIDFGYGPGEPPGAMGTAVVWQYEVLWYPSDPKDPLRTARFDTNLALRSGFLDMWKP